MGDDTRDSFFISYSGEDIDFATEVNTILNKAGYKTIWQKRDFGTKNFMSQISQALASDARVIALYSPEYLASQYSEAEAMGALVGDPLNNDERLIPIKIAECNPPGLLANIAYLDLTASQPTGPALRDIILNAVKPGAMQQGKAGHGLWRKPKVILHPDIAPVPNFSARADELQKLKTILFSGQTAAVTATISAMGGVGKTVLARQYAWENREAYAGVWWIASENPEDIITDLIELGSKFGTGIERIEDRKEAAQQTLQIIADAGSEKPWLLIYDNIEDPSALKAMTPRTGAHVLVTSRWKDWDGYAETLDLELFSDEDAIRFLLKRTGSTDKQGASELAAILGNLPLALEQAAAYCRNGVSFADYISSYQDMLKKQPKPNSQYPSSVWATFTLALETVIDGDETKSRPPCPEATKLLGPIAYLAPDDIPLEIFPDDYLSTTERITVVNALADVSLITPVVLQDGSRGLSLHRLVQEVVRDRNDETEEQARLALYFIANAFPDGAKPADVRFWPQCQKLEPHVRYVLEFARKSSLNPDNEAHLSNQYAMYLNVRADYSSAEPLYCLALKIWEDSLGADHPDVAQALNNQANLLRTTNRLSEAEPLYRRALKIREDSLGPDHPDVALMLNNLAALLSDTNRLSEAEPLYRRALKIREDSLGADHPDVALSLNGLANLLSDTNRLSEAEPLYRRALKIWEDSLGADHPDVAQALNNLAILLKATNRLSEAEPLYRRALKIWEDSLGPDHPDVAHPLNGLANLLSATNRLSKAEPLYRRALKIREDSLPEGHPLIEESRRNLRLFLEKKAQSSEAHAGDKKKTGMLSSLFGWRKQ